MTDKKSCQNCKRYRPGESCFCRNFADWQRNPDKWLSILPTEPGLYFWRPDTSVKYTVVELWKISTHLCKSGLQVFFFGTEGHDFLDDIQEGEWQGPIVPKEDK